jgi:hypothetical protein
VFLIQISDFLDNFGVAQQRRESWGRGFEKCRKHGVQIVSVQGFLKIATFEEIRKESTRQSNSPSLRANVMSVESIKHQSNLSRNDKKWIAALTNVRSQRRKTVTAMTISEHSATP